MSADRSVCTRCKLVVPSRRDARLCADCVRNILNNIRGMPNPEEQKRALYALDLEWYGYAKTRMEHFESGLAGFEELKKKTKDKGYNV